MDNDLEKPTRAVVWISCMIWVVAQWVFFSVFCILLFGREPMEGAILGMFCMISLERTEKSYKRFWRKNAHKFSWLK